MSEHLIRLRGGWERLEPGERSPATRVTLPLLGFPEGPGRVRLSRWFQAPRLEPGRETLWLRLDAVAGLIAVVLNDSEIAHGPFPTSPVLVRLSENLSTRNRIVLEVESPQQRDPAPADFRWGEVALVVRGVDPA